MKDKKYWAAMVVVLDNGENTLIVTNNVDAPKRYVLNKNGNYILKETFDPNKTVMVSRK